MLYKKNICVLFCTFMFMPIIFTMDIEEGNQDSVTDFTSLLQEAFGDGDNQQSFSSLKTIADDQMELHTLLNRRIEQQKNLLFYLDKVALCEATDQEKELFLKDLPRENRGEVIQVFDHYSRLKKNLLETIEQEDVTSFTIQLNSILRLTQCALPPLNSMSENELETIFTVIEQEVKRLNEINDYLYSFNNFKWIAQNPSTARAIFIAIPVMCLVFANYMCYHILYKFETQHPISLKKSVAIFGLADLLLFSLILIYSKIIPSNFLCCKKNTAKIETSAIHEMKDLLAEQINTKMASLKQIHTIVKALKKCRLEVEDKNADTSNHTELLVDLE